MPYQAKVILDSISSEGVRLCTFELTYPLIIHNELLTHRTIGRSSDHEFEEWLEFSRNSSSNRAISSDKIIKQVLNDPYYPEKPRYSSKGMIPGSYMNDEDASHVINEWLEARIDAVASVKSLQDLRLAKQWRNRILGPWQFITVVATANESHWQHFFNLRNHLAAQDEIHKIAEMAQIKFKNSVPQLLKIGEWHTPYVTTEDLMNDKSIKLDEEYYLYLRKMISVAKCARTSFLRQDELISAAEDIALYQRLDSATPPHGSPFEHVAQAANKDLRSGNLYGWKQLRKELNMV